jgi:ATP-binding cassette subfamily B (MDR/TAP) protein 6
MKFPVNEILTYVGLLFLSGGGTGGMGLLNNLRSFLWISVSMYTTRISRVDIFRHLHSLSLRWHLSRKTGEGSASAARPADFSHRHSPHLLQRCHQLGKPTGLLLDAVLKMVDRGTDSVNSLLSYILFNILPTVVDIGSLAIPAIARKIFPAPL